MTIPTGIAASLALAGSLVLVAAPAAAQRGDTALSYQGGVVYDDDLVPGRGLDSPFLIEEREAPAAATEPAPLVDRQRIDEAAEAAREARDRPVGREQQ